MKTQTKADRIKAAQAAIERILAGSAPTLDDPRAAYALAAAYDALAAAKRSAR